MSAPVNGFRSALFINGQSIVTTNTSTITDPARPADIVGEASFAGPSDITAAISAASDARTAWASMDVAARATRMRDAVDNLDAIRDDTAELLTREIGKTLHESWVDTKVFDIRWGLATALSEHFADEHVIHPDGATPNETLVQHVPVGVVTIIVPFNWPLAIVAASLPYALIAGNTVTVKVPETAPLGISNYLNHVAAELPAGVLNIVCGDNDVVEPLINDARIGHVCFTGSVGAGQTIMRLAAGNLTRVTLELGGNDPAIVLDDAALTDADLDNLFASVFDTSGQICMNVKRIYVHESQCAKLVAGLRTRLESVVLGHGLDAATTHGPLHRREQADFVEALLVDAERSGATIERFGSVPEGDLADGYFVRPALVLNPDPTSRIVVDEQFGPVIPIMTFVNDEDALAAANDTWAGLGASVWGTDESRIASLASRLEAGYVWVNDHGAPRLDLRAPFGGMKRSGFGREQGIEALHEFTVTRAISRIRSVT